MIKMVDRWKMDDDGDVWLEIVPPVKKSQAEVLKGESEQNCRLRSEGDRKRRGWLRYSRCGAYTTIS